MIPLQAEIDEDDLWEKQTTQIKIFHFLSTVQDEELKKKFDHDKKNFESLVTVLKDYFESKECVDINLDEDTLKLSFDIFKDKRSWSMSKLRKENDQKRPTFPEIDSAAPFLREETPRNYWFLRLLETEKSLEPICNHPYITAFLDLHYSVTEKASAQMRDSVPHLALILLLLELASTMNGRLCAEHENIQIFAAPSFF